MDDPYAPKLAKEVVINTVAMHLFAMRGIIDDLIRIRCHEFGSLLDEEEGELMAIRQSLEFLLTDIRESRINKARQFKVVSNG